MSNLDLTIAEIMHGDTQVLKIMKGDTKVWPSGDIAIVLVNTRRCSCSAASSRVSLHDSFSATLTADTSCEISSVTVTMGGIDITSSAYSNGTITIADVAGDITITATAVLIIIPTLTTAYSSYYIRVTDGKRLSNSNYNITNPIEVLAGDIVIAHCNAGSSTANAVISKYNEGANYTPLERSDGSGVAKDWTYEVTQDCSLAFSYSKNKGGTISAIIRRA